MHGAEIRIVAIGFGALATIAEQRGKVDEIDDQKCKSLRPRHCAVKAEDAQQNRGAEQDAAMLDHHAPRQGQVGEQSRRSQHETDLAETAANRRTHDDVGSIAGLEVEDGTVYSDCEFRQVAADRQDGNADNELGDSEARRHGDGAANGQLGTEPEPGQAE